MKRVAVFVGVGVGAWLVLRAAETWSRTGYGIEVSFTEQVKSDLRNYPLVIAGGVGIAALLAVVTA